jgi:hypothetical protein
MNPAQLPTEADLDGNDGEIESQIADHRSERAALRAVLQDFDALLADADRGVLCGFLRGHFSQGARPVASGDEP